MFCLPRFPPQRLGFDLATPEPSISSFFNLLGTFEGICSKRLVSHLSRCSAQMHAEHSLDRFCAPIRPHLVLDVWEDVWRKPTAAGKPSLLSGLVVVTFFTVASAGKLIKTAGKMSGAVTCRPGAGEDLNATMTRNMP